MMIKGLKKISMVIVAVYFVSMVAGPSYGMESTSNEITAERTLYGWKGTFNRVKYEMAIVERGVYAEEIMKRNSEYSIQIICLNEGMPVPELRISLPDGFELMAEPTKEEQSQIYDLSWIPREGKWPVNNWKHIFELKSPDKGGKYQLVLNGKDSNSKSFNFEVPITVVDDYVAYKIEKENNAYPPAFLIVATLIGSLALIGQFIFK